MGIFRVMSRTIYWLSLVGWTCLSLSLQAQCGFNHSLFARYHSDQPEPIWVADHMYSGEYLELELTAGLCYRMVMLDTAARAMHMRLLNDLGDQPLALTASPGGEAMVLTYRPPIDQTVLLTLNLSDCVRSWIPVQVIIERGTAEEACLPPDDRFWQTPSRIARYLFSHIR
jgi:hypothetical protein